MFPRINKGPIEYTLEIGTAWSVPTQRECLRFRFRTAEDFHYFQYNIAIGHIQKANVLEITLKGLKTGDLTLPATGKAEGVVDFFDLKGEYDITVTKPGNVSNTFRIDVLNNNARIMTDIDKSDRFLEIYVYD